MQTHVWREAELLYAVDNMLNKVMSHWVINLVVLHYQLPKDVNITDHSTNQLLIAALGLNSPSVSHVLLTQKLIDVDINQN